MKWNKEINIAAIIKSYQDVDFDQEPSKLDEAIEEVAVKLESDEDMKDQDFPGAFRLLKGTDADQFDDQLNVLYDYADQKKIWLGI